MIQCKINGRKLLSQGYLSLEDAKNKNLITSKFMTPPLSKKEKLFIYCLDRNAGLHNYKNYKPWWKFWG